MIFFAMMAVVLPVRAFSVVEKDDAFCIDHSWTFKGQQWSCHLQIGKDIYFYYKNHRDHSGNDFRRYALSEYDRPYIADIVESLRKSGTEAGFTDSENVLNVVALVQSLSYFTDAESTGQEDYVRYPLETLVDGGGDCEDTALLIAAILHEMGYGLALVLLPNHLALAVRGDGALGGTYYMYENQRYYYLETTNVGWNLGEMPTKFEKQKAEILPLIESPAVYIRSYDISSVDYTNETVTFKIICKIENMGPKHTQDLRLVVAAQNAEGLRKKIVAEKTVSIGEIAEGRSLEQAVLITVPRKGKVVFGMMACGQNFESHSLFSDAIDLR